MHGATIKIVNAQQAVLIGNYKNTKLKLLKTNAAVWFNKFFFINHRVFLNFKFSKEQCMLPEDDLMIRNM